MGRSWASTQVGEPHCRRAAFEFRDGLSRTRWKDMCGRGSLLVWRIVCVLNLCLAPNGGARLPTGFYVESLKLSVRGSVFAAAPRLGLKGSAT